MKRQDWKFVTDRLPKHRWWIRNAISSLRKHFARCVLLLIIWQTTITANVVVMDKSGRNYERPPNSNQKQWQIHGVKIFWALILGTALYNERKIQAFPSPFQRVQMILLMRTRNFWQNVQIPNQINRRSFCVRLHEIRKLIDSDVIWQVGKWSRGKSATSN